MPEQKETKQSSDAEVESKKEEKLHDLAEQKDAESKKKEEGENEKAETVEGGAPTETTGAKEKKDEDDEEEVEEEIVSADVKRQEEVMKIRIRDARKSRKLDLSGSTGKSYFQLQLDRIPNDVYQTFSESL